MADERKRKVAFIGCGGTISSLGQNSRDLIDYPEFGQKLGVEEVIARVPELTQIAEIVPVPFKAVSSTALEIDDWLAIRSAIHDAFIDPELSGIVVLHGTGSLEETAFFLHLTVNDRRPVVVVGSQRPLNAVSSDAPLNLINAARVACSAASQNRGVLVVMNDEINSARDSIKSSNYRVETFWSANGRLGQADADQVTYVRRIEGRHTAGSPFAGLDVGPKAVRVDILYSYVGTDDALLKASLAAGANGLVCVGFPPGLLSPLWRGLIAQEARDDFPIILTSRAISGRVINRRWVQENGLLAGGDFSPQKARIILLLGLMSGWRRAEFRAALPLL